MNVMTARANWCIAVAAVACFAAGVALSHRVEPGVRVEAVTLAGDTPALKFLVSYSTLMAIRNGAGTAMLET
jgi:hypothetical protein